MKMEKTSRLYAILLYVETEFSCLLDESACTVKNEQRIPVYWHKIPFVFAKFAFNFEQCT